MDKTNFWTDLLRQPALPQQAASEEIYRAACIGAVSLLYEAGNSAGLADAVLHAASQESRLRALTALENMTRASGPYGADAVRSLYELAIISGHRQSAEFLRTNDIRDSDTGWNSAGMLLFGQKHRLLKSDPGPEKLSELFLSGNEALRIRLLDLGSKTLPNWAALMRFLDKPSAENRQTVLTAYRNFSPDERKLLHFCCTDRGGPAASLPADLFLRYEDETLPELCLKYRLLPSDTSQEALFYFLSGQWEQYYASDSDYRRIRIAYEGKDPELQRRLITVSRESGNNAWLRHISGSQENTPQSGTLSDHHLLTASLIEQRQWDRLRELLPNLPLLCMPAVCEALSLSGHKPPQAEEMSFLRDLTEKIKAAEGLSPIPVSGRYRDTGGTALCLCSGGPRFAVLYSDRRIMVWNTDDDHSAPVCIASNQMTFRQIVLSHDGKYLCADCGNGILTVFTLPGGQSVKTLRTDGSPLAGIFLQPDGRRIILLGQNGKGAVFTFPGGAELFRFDIGLKDCCRSAYDPQANRFCGITLSGECTLYDISERRIVTSLKPGGAIPAAAEFFSAGKLSFANDDGTLSRINLLSGKPILDRINTGTGKIRRILELSGGDLYALGTIDGQVCIFDPASGSLPAVLSFGSKSAVTGLCYDEAKATLFGCTANGIVRGWDLNLFKDMCRVLPLTQLPGMNKIDEFCKKYPEPGVKAAAAWFKTVIAWRRRFDIELDFE